MKIYKSVNKESDKLIIEHANGDVELFLLVNGVTSDDSTPDEETQNAKPHRRRRLSREIRSKIEREIENGIKFKVIHKQYGISPSTYYKIKKDTLPSNNDH